MPVGRFVGVRPRAGADAGRAETVPLRVTGPRLLVTADTAPSGSVWPLVLYCCSATVCLLLSAVYHCFGTAMSRDMHDLFARLDFAGITTLIAGSCFPIIYYTFYCRPILQQRYLLLVSGCGLPLMFCCATKWYMAPEYSSLRVFNFLMLGAGTLLYLFFY